MSQLGVTRYREVQPCSSFGGLFAAVLAILGLAAGATVASADRGHDHNGRGHDHGGRGGAERLFTLQPDPAGNPEGVAFDRRSRAFFVGITTDGAIYRGTLGSKTVSPFIAGATGKSAVGLKVRRGKLYVAGGETGLITVYDLATKQAVATFDTGKGGFLNDLVVTRRGDVFVTDSFRPILWHVTGEQVRAGSGTPQELDVSKEIQFEDRSVQPQRDRREGRPQAGRRRTASTASCSGSS